MVDYEYPVLFSRAPEGGWVITCRTLPEAISQAEENEDRIGIASGCIQAALETRMEDGEILPSPGKKRACEMLVAPPVNTITKMATLVSHLNRTS